MKVTLLSALDALPELTGRVFPTAVVAAPTPPYARIWQGAGGTEAHLFHRQSISTLNWRITLYDRPTGPDSNQARAAARLRLEKLARKVRAAVNTVNTHLDGETPYTEPPLIRGEGGILDDAQVPGQSYLTLFLSVNVDRP